MSCEGVRTVECTKGGIVRVVKSTIISVDSVV